ncbi:MAG: histidine phosphotransferase family protein [Alphaproteobacteria bacterium]
MLNKIELSELMAAKFSHDLAGPIGAINNGVEFLLDQDESMKARAYQLVETSSKQAVARLQFFRQAYGIAPKIGEANLAEIKILIENFLVSTKLKLVWEDENVATPGLFVGPKFAKILLNIIVLLQNVLIHGGNVDVKLSKIPNGKKVEVTAIGQNWRIDQEMEKLLSNNSEGIEISSKNIQVYFTNELIQDLGAKLKIEKSEKFVRFILEYTKL